MAMAMRGGASVASEGISIFAACGNCPAMFRYSDSSWNRSPNLKINKTAPCTREYEDKKDLERFDRLTAFQLERWAERSTLIAGMSCFASPVFKCLIHSSSNGRRAKNRVIGATGIRYRVKGGTTRCSIGLASTVR